MAAKIDPKEDFKVEDEENLLLTAIEEGDEEDFFEIEEEKSLSSVKILGLVGIGVFAFLVFFLLLFPLEHVIKSYLGDWSRSSGIVLEFKEIRFPFFGSKSIDSLVIQPSAGTILKSEETFFQISMFSLMKREIDGDIEMNSLHVDSGDTSILIKSLQVSAQLGEFEERLTKANGDIRLNLRGGKIASLPQIPMVGEVKDIAILKGNFHLKIRSGKIQLDQASLDTSWFKLQITGNIRLSDSLPYSALDIKVCAQAQEKFAQERPDLAGMLAILPQEGGRACLPIKGTINSPQAELPAPGSSIPNDGQPSGNLESDQPVVKDSESRSEPQGSE